MKTVYLIMRYWRHEEAEPVEVHVHASSRDRAIIDLTEKNKSKDSWYDYEPITLVASK